MKRTHLLVALAGLALALPLAATSAKRPGHINLPNGWQPEGIAIKSNSFYVGSIPTGRVWKGNLRTGQGAELVPEPGAARDRRRGRSPEPPLGGRRADR